MELSIPLLQWYDKNRRTFPWREKKFKNTHEHAYHTWVCEVMSQQTLLKVLLPKYLEFLKELPDIDALAHCSEAKLRNLWSGLGYYARARNLQKGALYILNERQGFLPTNQQEWQKVPGCGTYTSAVISSICYNEPVVAIDGNVIRVTSRLLNLQDSSVWKPEGYKKIFTFLQNNISLNRPGDLNQALMDLGATVCKKSSPECNICPLQKDCVAYKKNTVSLCPPTKPRRSPILQDLAACVLKTDNKPHKHLLVRRKEGFLKSTLGYPLLKQNPFSWEKISAVLQEAGYKGYLCAKKFTHSITHHKIQCYVIVVEAVDMDAPMQKLSEIFDFTEEVYWIDKNKIDENISSSLDQKISKIWQNQEQKKCPVSNTLFDLSY